MSERSIFLAALEIADRDERSAFLDRACANDATLRRHIDDLIAREANLGSFLGRPHAAVQRTDDLASVARPGVQIGPYKLREQIGEGGFGVVYVAEQEKPVRRKVALKIIKPGMDTKDVIARFEAERQALALMDHPNVARVLDAGATDTGRPFFVMELVHGVPITEFCDKNKLPTRDRLLLFADVCRAVQHAHQKGIIHRDLKPSNIMVTLHDGKPVAKVIDFGVSKALSQQLTEKSIYTAYGQMIGTPSYMSPEQAEMSGLGIDTRSDIYSLGVLLYELLTGTTPLDAKRLRASAYAEILRIIREEEPQRPSLKISTLGEQATIVAEHRHTDPTQLRRELAGELDWIVLKCLEKDRSRRYETASNLARDVERYLNDEQVEACPPSLSYRTKKYLRKNRTVVITTLAIIAGSIAALIGQTANVIKAHRAEARAERERQSAQASEDRALASEKAAREAQHAATQSQHLAEQEKNKTLAAKEELRETLYASEMNLVQAAVESHQYARAAQLLEQQRPAPGQSDLRGFEWHYWQRRLKRGQLRSLEIPQLALSGHTSSVTRLFSRDAVRLLALVDSPSDSQTKAPYGLLTIFDTSTGRELIAPFDPSPSVPTKEHSRPLVTISKDGSRLATILPPRNSQAPGYITIRDGSTGSETRRIGSRGNVTELALTMDGSRLAVEYLVPEPLPSPAELRRMARQDLDQLFGQRRLRLQAAVKVWDTSTGELIQTLPQLPWTGLHGRILWSADGTRLLRQSVTTEMVEDKQTFREAFQVINVASGEKVWEREFSSHAIPRRAWSWSPDGKLVVIFEVAESGIAAKHNAQLWDSATGTTLAILDRENPSDGTVPGNIDFSPDGRLLAVASAASDIYVWDVSKLSLPAGTDPLHVAAPHLTLQIAQEDIQAVAFSSDSRELNTVAGTSLVTWDATVREDLGTGPDSLEGFFTSDISADATKVAFCTGSLRTSMSCLWDLTKNREVFRQPTGDAFSRPAFTADGRRVALVRNASAPERTSEIAIYDTQTGEALMTVRVDQKILESGTYLDHAFRPDGGQLAAIIQPFRTRSSQAQAPESPRLMAWDGTTGQQLFSVPINATYAHGLVYTPDGARLVLGTSNQIEMAAEFYDAATGERQRSVSMPNTPRTAVEILMRHQIFASFVGRDAIFSDLQTGQERFRLPGCHDLADCAISPDGSRLAAGRPLSFGGESEVSLWSLKTGRRLLALKRQGTVESISFSPDGNRLVATFYQPVPNATKPIQIWDATPLPEP